MKNRLNLNHIQALISDIDGTLWRGSEPLPGLTTFFEFLRQRRIAFTLVTNNTIRPPAQYCQKLARFGVTVELEQILSAATATGIYLRQTFEAGASVYLIGEEGLRQAIQSSGLTLLNGAGQPAAAVVVGGDRNLTYDKLKQAILLIQDGAALIGSNPDMLVPTQEGLVPEAGTTLAAIQAATGVAPTIIGKPERLLFELAMERMGSSPGQTAMLGDRLDTDIRGGRRAGLQTILVTTGVDNQETILQKGIEPDGVFGGLDELVAVWRG